jgi:hypothetical protein
MEEKKCYPNGCVYFKWKCKDLAKKKKCHRNFTSVGKYCFSCKYFYAEKIHQYPDLIIEDRNKFFEEYEKFCEWVTLNQNKTVFCEGTIYSVLPDFIAIKKNGKLKLEIKGFLITFNEGFIANQHFEDNFYLHVDIMLQNRLRLRPNDEIEFKAIFKEKKGKIELVAPRHFNFYLRGNDKPLLRSDLLVSLNTATTFNIQPDKCKKCVYSIIPNIQNNRSGKNRVLICTKGIHEPENCMENLTNNKFYYEFCEKDKTLNFSCNKIL